MNEVKEKPERSTHSSRRPKNRRPSGGRGRKRVPGMTRLSSKNQVTLPVDAVRKAGIKHGDELSVSVDDEGRIMLSVAKPKSVIEEVAGSLTGVYGPNYLEELRAGDREREIALGLIIEDDNE